MIDLDRRTLLGLATAGSAALAMPGAAQALSAATGFTHNVASGEPSANSVLLWTRYVAPGDTSLTVEMSDGIDFTRIVVGGTVVARGDADHTAKIVVTGLAPNRWYYYRFVAPDGTASPVGRTRTLPDDALSHFRVALFSCSNMRFGWFNAYAHAAGRSDIDLVVHVGDYFYEYGPDTYPTPEQAVAGRAIAPQSEVVALADYRLRYAAYRTDRDLQRLHQLFPWLSQADDHEYANGAWREGAENHNPGEGEWTVRKAMAARAYREWMPVSDILPRSYRIGDLATLIMPETRVTGRDDPLDLARALAGGGDMGKNLVRFRDDVWSDPKHSILGAAQEAWMDDELRKSVASGARWQIVPQQVVMGTLNGSTDSTRYITPETTPQVRAILQAGAAAASIGLPFNFESWSGYPAARARLFASAMNANANFVSLAGDSHNAWAFSMMQDGAPAGVEFAGQSVTSPGFEGYLPGTDNASRVAGLMQASPELAWAETSKRGYVTLMIARDRIDTDYHFLDSVRTRGTTLSSTHRETVLHGNNRLETA